ncbi:MAG TPA: DUF459 domain-containing protein [Thermoleophilia bacterium]|nr:DUF459 domain-containing protein [Thermoleophilia bacterium]
MPDDRGQEENEGRPDDGGSDDEFFVWGDLRPPRPGSPRPSRPASPPPDAYATRDEETRREEAAPEARRRSAKERHRRARAGRDESRARPAGSARPPRRSRRGASAGATLLAMLVGFFFAGLLDVGAIEKEIAGRPLGTGRSIQLALLKPMLVLSEASRFDRPAAALNNMIGRGEQQHHSLADVTPAAKPKWPREITREKPLRLAIVGDSMAMVFGSSLKNLAEDTRMIKAKLDYRVSSGLSRPDFFDWPQHMIDELVEFDPDATAVLFGANDGQNVMHEGKVLKVGSAAWQRVYQKRIGVAMDILTRGGRRAYWVANPIMRDAGYRDRIAMMNSLYEAEAQRHPGVFFVDTWDILADEKGRYAEYLRNDDGDLVLMRGDDGIHLTRAGGDRMAAGVLEVIEKDWAISSPSAAD